MYQSLLGVPRSLSKALRSLACCPLANALFLTGSPCALMYGILVPLGLDSEAMPRSHPLYLSLRLGTPLREVGVAAAEIWTPLRRILHAYLSQGHPGSWITGRRSRRDRLPLPSASTLLDRIGLLDRLALRH